MSKVNSLLFTLIAGFIAGCTQMSQANPIAAVLTEPSEQSLTAIKTAIKSQLNISSVRLADDAFVNSSWLSLERIAHRDSQGNPIMGIELTKPEKFQLVLVNKGCALLHLATGAILPLSEVSCKALTPSQ